jgi:hypothetical protein
MSEQKSAAELKAAQAAYLEKQRAMGVQLSPAATEASPGVRLHRTLERAERLVRLLTVS